MHLGSTNNVFFSMEIAEEVFHSLPEKTADAYNWITRGMAKVCKLFVNSDLT